MSALLQVSGIVLRRMDTWVLLEAGLDPEQTGRLFDATIGPNPESRHTLTFQLSELALPAVAEVLFEPGPTPTTARIEATSGSAPLIERLGTLLQTYAANPDGKTYRDQERIDAQDRLDTQALNRALASAQLPPLQGHPRTKRIDEATARVLINVYENSSAFRTRLSILFDLQAPKTSKPVKMLLSNWLIKQFPRFENRRHRGQIGCALHDLVGPGQVASLASTLEDEKLGADRRGLLVVLGRTRAVEAGPVLASYLDGSLKIAALQGLGELGRKGADQAPAVHRLLQDPDPVACRLAKQALRRMGDLLEAPAEPAHLVRGKVKKPQGYGDWTVGLDLADLTEALAVVASVVDGGLGPTEINEIAAVVDVMKLDQTRWFRFPVTFLGSPHEVLVGVFLDDLDTPDLCVMAQPEFTSRLDVAWRQSRFFSTGVSNETSR